MPGLPAAPGERENPPCMHAASQDVPVMAGYCHACQRHSDTAGPLDPYTARCAGCLASWMTSRAVHNPYTCQNTRCGVNHQSTRLERSP
jgi:hypothetical protein